MAIVSLGRALTNIATADPTRPAVTCDGITTSRAELEALSNRMARAFDELGVKQGDFVTIGLPNSAKFYAAAFALWKLGAVPQPVSPRLPIRERQGIVELANSPIVVGADIDAHPGRVCLPMDWLPDESLSSEPLEDRIAPAWKAPTSGGSTGRPKLIVASDPGVLDDEADPGQGVQRNGTMMVPGPLYHNAPFSYSSRALANGNHIVTMGKFDAQQTLAGVQEHQCDWMLLVPTMMLRIWRLNDREEYDMSSLRVVWHMAAPCPPWLKESFINWLGGEKLFELYAGTEAQAVTVIRGDEWLSRRGSVGRCIMGEMKVLDEDNNLLPFGEVGEIYMRAPVGRQTYRYVGAQAKTTADGWESLGDMGWMDADGYVYLSDRLTDMILSGGANIYPAEIESAIDEYPSVRSSAAIGLPDEDLGARVHAIVQLAAGTEIDLDHFRAFLGERLVRYKVPRTFEFVDEPLRDDAGKVRRSQLRADRVPTEI
ncbi:putative acid-CoA ligase [Actinomycetes bacterium]|nr:putative acid-CoA ligase [Actinomycetes bacterium]